MSDHDARYYRERAATERAMALASERQEVREIHEELARQYDALVEQATFDQPCASTFHLLRCNWLELNASGMARAARRTGIGEAAALAP